MSERKSRYRFWIEINTFCANTITMDDDGKSPRQRVPGSTGPNATRLADNRKNAQSLSAFDYAYGIPPPTYSYLGSTSRAPAFSDSPLTRSNPAQGSRVDNSAGGTERLQKRQDLTDSIMDWYSMSRSGTHEVPQQSDIESARRSSDGGDGYYSGSDENVIRRRNSQSNVSLDSDGMENSSDGKSYRGGTRSDEDSENETLRRMDYKTRRKHIQRVRIQFNVSSKCPM
jgi:hypothetical protein